MKTNSKLKTYKSLKRGNGFKKNKSSLKRSSFKKSMSKETSEIVSLDSKFSKIILARDRECLNCGKTRFLSCSHFFSRSIWSTRWDILNCITLCLECHDSWESKKKGVYRDFMISWLGLENFYALENRAKSRVSKNEAIEYTKSFINMVEVDKDIQY